MFANLQMNSELEAQGMDNDLSRTRQHIVEIAAELFQRRLTDAAGGNISVRVDDVILMTPTLAGARYHWRLGPEQILVLDLQGTKLEGEGEVSREAKVHLSLLNEFYPLATSVIHGHARNVLVFCAAEKPIPPVLNCAMKFGEIIQVPDAPSGTTELAENITEALREQQDRVQKQAAAVMAPRHGIFVLSRNIHSAFDALERIDTNAYCLIHGKQLFNLEAPMEIPYEDSE